MIFWTWYAMITAMALHVYEMYVGIHLRRLGCVKSGFYRRSQFI